MCISTEPQDTHWQQLWPTKDDNSASTQKPTVSVDGDRIKIRVTHFSLFHTLLKRLKGSKVKMEIIASMHPPKLTSLGVFINIYAVRVKRIQVGYAVLGDLNLFSN